MVAKLGDSFLRRVCCSIGILKPFQLVIHAVTPLICRAVPVVSFLESTWQPFEKTHTTEKYLHLGPLVFSWVNLHFFTYVVPQLRWEAILHFSFIFVSGFFLYLCNFAWMILRYRAKISGSKTKKEEKWEHACLCPSFGFDFIVLFVWHSKIVCLCLHFLRTARHYYILNCKLSVAYLAKNMTWRFSIPIELIQEAHESILFWQLVVPQSLIH
jgi:hypothetical protein